MQDVCPEPRSYRLHRPEQPGIHDDRPGAVGMSTPPATTSLSPDATRALEAKDTTIEPTPFRLTDQVVSGFG